MCVVVNLDLVVPAVISLEFLNMRCLDGYSNNAEKYLDAMTISTHQVMNYAHRMKSWDLGRVVVNFGEEDADRYFKTNSDIFVQIGHSRIYSIQLPYETGKKKDSQLSELIQNLTSKINYSPYILRAVGLLYD